MKFVLIVFYLSSLSVCGQMINVQCIDESTGQPISSANLNRGQVFLLRQNGERDNLGPVIDGSFEIEHDCKRGDQYTVIVDEGNYFGDTFYCSVIKKQGNKFPLYSKANYQALLDNSKYLDSQEFENEIVQYASLAYINNEIAYLNLSRDSIVYNIAAKSVYTSLGKIFGLEQATRYDVTQQLWVPLPELEDAIMQYKTVNNFKNINGKTDFTFFKNLTGMKPSDRFKSAEFIYSNVEIKGVF